MRPEIPRTLMPATHSPTVEAKTLRIMVEENFDLRGAEPKQDTLRNTPLCTGWMVFINKARTLAHIMHQLDASDGTYIRMKIPHNLRGAKLQAYFYYRMKGRYVI